MTRYNKRVTGQMGWPGSARDPGQHKIKKNLFFLKGFSLSIFSTLRLLCLCSSLASIYTSKQSNIKRDLFFPLRSLSFFFKFSLYRYPNLGRHNRERRELEKEKCFFFLVWKKISTWMDPRIPPLYKLFLISFFLSFFINLTDSFQSLSLLVVA